jgi:hypothetical protein
MGMPMGGLGGLGGAPGGGSGGGKGETDRRRKVAVRDVPHTEDVTGRVDLDRLSAAASGGHDPEPPDDSSGPDPVAPVVRRLVTKPPKEPS